MSNIVPTVTKKAEVPGGNGARTFYPPDAANSPDPFAKANATGSYKIPDDDRPIGSRTDVPARGSSTVIKKDVSMNDEIYSDFKTFAEYMLDTSAYHWSEGWLDAIELIEERMIHFQNMNMWEARILLDWLGDLHTIRAYSEDLQDREKFIEHLVEEFGKKVMGHFGMQMPSGNGVPALKHRAKNSAVTNYKAPASSVCGAQTKSYCTTVKKPLTEAEQKNLSEQLATIAAHKVKAAAEFNAATATATGTAGIPVDGAGDPIPKAFNVLP